MFTCRGSTASDSCRFCEESVNWCCLVNWGVVVGRETNRNKGAISAQSFDLGISGFSSWIHKPSRCQHFRLDHVGRDINMYWLVDYFAGELSEEEAAEVEAWIEEDPDRRAQAEALRQIWDAAGQSPSSEDRDVGAMWNQLSDRMENDPEPQSASSSSHDEDTDRAGTEGRRPVRPHHGRRRRSRSRRQSWRVAAVTALLLIGTVATVFMLGEEAFERVGLGSSGAFEMREVVAKAGQHTRVQLSDGTQVVLNAKSTLWLPEDGFTDGRRQVRLEGEAYFEVTSDEKRPFIVRTDKAAMQVLGTAFDVSAYPDDETVQVTVAEGKVSARAEKLEESSKVVLSARQSARLSSQSAPVVKKNVDVAAKLAWKEGRIVFQDAPLSEVARKLERWYGLQVNLDGQAASVTDRLNAVFEGEAVSEVLSVIAKTLGLRYERSGKTVQFYPRGSSSAR